MALPLIPLGIGLLGGYVIVKNKEKILSALHGHKAPTFPAKGAPISAPTQAWLAQQTPEDQALFSQMMASGQFQVGQYMDPSMFGYGAGYPDPSQYGYYDRHKWVMVVIHLTRRSTADIRVAIRAATTIRRRVITTHRKIRRNSSNHKVVLRDSG